MGHNHFDGELDPVATFEELTEDEEIFCAQTAAAMFMTWSGCHHVIGTPPGGKVDLDKVIMEQLKIMIWG